MDYQMKKLDNDTWCIEEDEVRFFLLMGTDQALMIDCGMQIRNAKEIAEVLTDLPIRLLLTHADRDHTGSIDEFDTFYMHPAEASNFYNTQHLTGKFTPVWDGDILDLGGRPLEIIAMPGHTPGSIAVLDVNNRCLFSGDPVQNGNIFLFGVQREIHSYLVSMKRLQTMESSFDRVYPSHGSCPVSPDLIDKLAQGMQDVIDGKCQPVQDQFFDIPILRYGMGYANFLLDDKEEQEKEKAEKDRKEP